MNKKIGLLLISFLLIVGCTKTKDKLTNNDELYAYLEQYGNKVFNDAWVNGGIREGTYTVTLKDMEDNLNYDVSIFKNTKGESCDKEKTKVEFIVNEQIEPNKTNYEFKYYLFCD